MPTTPHLDALAADVARRIFPQAHTLQVTRMTSGTSTWVYAIHLDNTRFYLRVLPEENASFAPEVYAHTHLRAAGLHVPEVVYYEHRSELLARSVMVTTEIPGAPFAPDAAPETVASVLREAGRELAILNQVAVEGFGWMVRTASVADALCGEVATYRAWMHGEMDEALACFRGQEVLASSDLALLTRRLAVAVECFDTQQATLAHGDFDMTHIFQSGGRYMGIIDFGEIRGTHPLYDLGHFAIEHAHWLMALLEGYGEISTLPDGYMSQIGQAALLVAVARAARRLARRKPVLAVDRQVIQHALSH